jgi:glucose dehydrogenase
MRLKSLSTILVAFAVVFGVSYAIATRQGAVSELDGSDWLYVDHDLAGTRYSNLKQINTKNVSRLTKICAYSFPDKEPSQTAPIVSAGVMYLTTAHYTVALDGSDCHVIWTNKWSPRDYETMNTQRGAAGHSPPERSFEAPLMASCWRSMQKTGTRFGLRRLQIRRRATSSACRR